MGNSSRMSFDICAHHAVGSEDSLLPLGDGPGPAAVGRRCGVHGKVAEVVLGHPVDQDGEAVVPHLGALLVKVEELVDQAGVLSGAVEQAAELGLQPTLRLLRVNQVNGHLRLPVDPPLFGKVGQEHGLVVVVGPLHRRGRL